MDNNGLKDNIDWMWMALMFKFGWAMAYSAWRTVLSFTYSIVSSTVEKFLAGLIPEDRAWADAILNNRTYRVLTVLFKVITSVQLPRAEVVAAVKQMRSGNTDIITKP